MCCKFVNDVQLGWLAWLLGAQAAHKKACLLECNQIALWGGKVGVPTKRLLPENSDSSREKSEGQTTYKKRKLKLTPRKPTNTSNLTLSGSQLLCSLLPVTHPAG